MTRNKTPTVDELWDVACCHFPAVSEEERRAAMMLLRELKKREPVTVAQLARALDVPVDKAEALAKESALSPFVHMDEEGQIQGSFGLSVTPTHHQVTIAGRKLWAWCAPDTLMYAQLLGDMTEIETRDPETDQLIRLTMSPAGIEAAEPADIFVSWRRSELWDTTSANRVIASACHFHFFFASRESGERWVAKHTGTLLLPLDVVFKFIRRLNRHMFEAELEHCRAAMA